MKIENKKLISVSDLDLVDGVFFNEDIIEVGDRCFYNMPSLKEVNLPKATKFGDLCIRNNPALVSINIQKASTFGNGCIQGNPALVSINIPKATTFGDGCIYDNPALVSINLPKATTFGDGCIRYNNALVSINLPNATTFGNGCIRWNNALVSINLPNATTFGNGGIRENNALVSINIPKATTFGNGGIRENPALVSINIQKATTFGDYCIQWNPALVSLTIKNTHFNVKYVDSYCFVIEKQRKFKDVIIYTGYNFGESIKCYVAEKDGFTAHGKTPKDAIKDLEFKIIAEKMKNDPIDKDTVITVEYYRAVTGACEFGVRSWMKENKIKVEEIKAGELLPILKKSGAYGVEKFQKLITF